MSDEGYTMQKLLSLADLKSKSVGYGRAHLDRLVKARKFPRPIKLGENRNAWVEAEVDAWIEQRIAERNAQNAKAA